MKKLKQFFLKWKRKFIVWRAYKRFPYNCPKIRMAIRLVKRQPLLVEQFAEAFKQMTIAVSFVMSAFKQFGEALNYYPDEYQKGGRL